MFLIVPLNYSRSEGKSSEKSLSEKNSTLNKSFSFPTNKSISIIEMRPGTDST